jgi:hypothetical protein
MAVKQQSKKPQTSVPDTRIESKFDLDSLLHPARAFAHPSDVVCDPDLGGARPSADWRGQCCVA